MATFLDGNRRRATANTKAAMVSSAEARQCPICGRKSALSKTETPDGLHRVIRCRWVTLCGYSRVWVIGAGWADEQAQ